ncbi:glycosyltransferase family 2 protein [Rathayibacter sp. VKM Ac-2856]|nr:MULTISPECIES: glycosyltransferase family A protein [unclassified Rathayibacter]NQX03967.1 glycosyltransferase family 2 protein [Rathayibacter sp. VKM Ac-2858]NQX19135.1 glycosyltransferase family 2 protein [Rathayibacter sp. VKM Ac-2856]
MSSQSYTVVIPAYRSESTIARAIESAFGAGAQRVLVIDDGSDDRTAAVAEAAGAEVLRQENAGASRARARGAELVSTDFVTFLDADDELLGPAVGRSIERLLERDDLVVAAGTVVGVGRDGRESSFPVRYSPVDTRSLLIRGFGPWPPAAEVIRVSALREASAISPVPLHLRFADDYELLIRLSIVGAVDVRNEATCRYSMAGGKSVTSAASAIEAKEQIRRHYAHEFGLSLDLMSQKQIKAAAHVRVARAHLSNGDVVAASREGLRYVTTDPRGALRRLRRIVVPF